MNYSSTCSTLNERRAPRLDGQTSFCRVSLHLDSGALKTLRAEDEASARRTNQRLGDNDRPPRPRLDLPGREMTSLTPGGGRMVDEVSRGEDISTICDMASNISYLSHTWFEQTDREGPR